MITSKELIKLFDLQPLIPEGGFFNQTYKSELQIKKECLPNGFGGSRSISTQVYFLLPEGSKSKLHRLKSDEVWHFYLGGPLTIIQLFENGKIEKVILGQDVKNGEKLQHVVPAGCMFGSFPNPKTEYSFVGCTVAPGFEFEDCEMGDKEKLLKQFPEAKEYIEKLTN